MAVTCADVGDDGARLDAKRFNEPRDMCGVILRSSKGRDGREKQRSMDGASDHGVQHTMKVVTDYS